MNYYEHHLGDYLRDTAHLSMLEDGAYRRLLDRIYMTEQGIPADQVHRVARARTKEEMAAVDTVLAEFFTLQDGVYMQARASAEIDRAQARIDTARRNGRTGGRPKKNPLGFVVKPRTNPEETQREPSGFSPGSENETQTITGSKALQTPDSKHQTPDSEVSLRSTSDARDPDAVEEKPRETQRVSVPRGTSAGEPNGTLPADAPLTEAELEATYPATAHDRDVSTALHSAQGLVNLGLATWADLRRRLQGFRAFADSGGYSGPDKTPGMAAWFLREQRKNPPYWAREWAAVPSKAQQQQDANLESSRRLLAGECAL